jgi:hypothetical protein
MTRLAFPLLAALSLGLAACGGALGGLATTPPAQVADATVLDERGAIAVESAYRAAGLALEMAVDTGLLRGSAAATAATYEQRAYTAVLAVRAAYDAGNATGYAAALVNARQAIARALLAVNGE